MDAWRYYELTHSAHDLLNPFAPGRLETLGASLGLGPGTRVLDIGCGHAEMLLLWHERFGIRGLGVDASPYHSRRALERAAARAPGAIEIVHLRGEDFASEERFDLACCLGASWIWGGHVGTLRALSEWARPGGVVVVGEPYWREEPPEAYLQAEGLQREVFHDLDGCRTAALDLGFELIWMGAATEREWDEYEMKQSVAVDAFARQHPEDEDLPALRARRRGHDEAYLRWGRRCLGWAVWALRAPGGPGAPARP